MVPSRSGRSTAPKRERPRTGQMGRRARPPGHHRRPSRACASRRPTSAPTGPAFSSSASVARPAWSIWGQASLSAPRWSSAGRGSARPPSARTGRTSRSPATTPRTRMAVARVRRAGSGTRRLADRCRQCCRTSTGSRRWPSGPTARSWPPATSAARFISGTCAPGLASAVRWTQALSSSAWPSAPMAGCWRQARPRLSIRPSPGTWSRTGRSGSRSTSEASSDTSPSAATARAWPRDRTTPRCDSSRWPQAVS
jgi:hypothetical protein